MKMQETNEKKMYDFFEASSKKDVANFKGVFTYTCTGYFTRYTSLLICTTAN